MQRANLYNYYVLCNLLFAHFTYNFYVSDHIAVRIAYNIVFFERRADATRQPIALTHRLFCYLLENPFHREQRIVSERLPPEINLHSDLHLRRIFICDDRSRLRAVETYKIGNATSELTEVAFTGTKFKHFELKTLGWICKAGIAPASFRR